MSHRHVVLRYGAAAGLAMAALLAPGAHAQTTIYPSFTFAASQASTDTPTGLTFDGTNYWPVRGGHTTGLQESQYSAGGVLIADYAPGLDFRSIFSAGPTGVFARAYNSRVIYKQTSDGVFSGVIKLQGGYLDPPAAVVLFNGASAQQLIARSGATVTTWDTSGQLIGTVALIGFGSMAGEANYPQNRGIAAHARLRHCGAAGKLGR